MSLERKARRVPPGGGGGRPFPGARFLAPADPNQRIEISCVVRPRQKPHPEQLAQARQRRKQLTREEFEAAYGAAPIDLELVEAFAHEYGLTVVETSRARRTVVLGGTIAAFSQAFGLQLAHYAHEGRTYRGRTGPVLIPKELAGAVDAALGLDDRAQATTHLPQRHGSGPHTNPR